MLQEKLFQRFSSAGMTSRSAPAVAEVRSGTRSLSTQLNAVTRQVGIHRAPVITSPKSGERNARYLLANTALPVLMQRALHLRDFVLPRIRQGYTNAHVPLDLYPSAVPTPTISPTDPHAAMSRRLRRHP